MVVVKLEIENVIMMVSDELECKIEELNIQRGHMRPLAMIP